MKQLPVLAAIRHTLSLTFNNLGPAFRITWAWMVVFAIAGGLFIWTATGIDIQAGGRPDGFAILVTGALWLLVILVATASIAVAWHRYILLDEGGNAAFNLRIDGTVWRYVGNAILIGLGIALVIGLPFVLLMQISEWLLVLILPALFLICPVMYRLLIKLPAIALERSDFGFTEAFDASQNNYWPLVGLAVVYFLVALAFNLAVGLVTLFGMLFGPLAVVFQLAATVLAEWIGIIFGISLLTTLYGYFVEGRSLNY